jgi:aldose 1-epimerase
VVSDEPAEYEIQAGGYDAAVCELGGTLRALRCNGRSLVREFPRGDQAPVWSGAVLAPWPNRIADGRYRFAGRDYQLPVNEPERGAALHGLVARVPWDATERAASFVVLEQTLWPSPGYPWQLAFALEYRLDASDGLQVTLSATNCSATAAPYGASIHPYVRAADGRVDDWTLHLPAGEVVDVDAERLLPLGSTSPVPAETDFRTPRRIGEAQIDAAFTALDPSAPRRATVTDDLGRGVVVGWGEESRWVQIHTADRPEPDLDRSGLALEPMTCPPDAFNSGVGLVVLDPGQTARARWTIAAVEPPSAHG